MAKSRGAVRVLPTLLQRLGVTEDATGPATGGLSNREFKASVINDLQMLFNATNLELHTLYPSSVSALGDKVRSLDEVRRSVLNYGVPNFAGRSVRPEDEGPLIAAVRRAIETFEPRLEILSISLYTDADSCPVPLRTGGEPGLFVFVIQANLWGDPYPEELTIATEVNRETASVTVEETRSQVPSSSGAE